MGLRITYLLLHIFMAGQGVHWNVPVAGSVRTLGRLRDWLTASEVKSRAVQTVNAFGLKMYNVLKQIHIFTVIPNLCQIHKLHIN